MAYLSDTEADQPHPVEGSRTVRHPPERYPSLPHEDETIYATLPAPDSKYAPKTFYGNPLELTRFLDYFRRTCLRHHVTKSEDKYQGLLQYCSDRVLTTLQNLDSSITQDYDELVKELYYFYGPNEATYSIGKIESFTAKWRKQMITSIDRFKRYHQKYLELVGEAKKSSQISDWDYDRYFWEGLHEAFRIRLEN